LSDSKIFIGMKNKKITIRITESQLNRILQSAVLSQTTKSKYIRNLIEKDENYCRNSVNGNRIELKPKNSVFNLFKRKITN
jgi:hypothetical protein